MKEQFCRRFANRKKNQFYPLHSLTFSPRELSIIADNLHYHQTRFPICLISGPKCHNGSPETSVKQIKAILHRESDRTDLSFNQHWQVTSTPSPPPSPPVSKFIPRVNKIKMKKQSLSSDRPKQTGLNLRKIKKKIERQNMASKHSSKQNKKKKQKKRRRKRKYVSIKLRADRKSVV